MLTALFCSSVSRAKFNHTLEFKSYDIELLELIPYSSDACKCFHVFGLSKVSCPYLAAYDAFYWKKDIRDLVARLTQLDTDVSLGKPGAVQLREDFKTEKKALVAQTRQVNLSSHPLNTS